MIFDVGLGIWVNINGGEWAASGVRFYVEADSEQDAVEKLKKFGLQVRSLGGGRVEYYLPGSGQEEDVQVFLQEMQPVTSCDQLQPTAAKVRALARQKWKRLSDLVGPLGGPKPEPDDVLR